MLCYKGCNDIFTSGTYARTTEGEVWVYQFWEEVGNLLEGESDDGNQDDNIKMIIFATAANLNYLGRSDIWYGDGTFTVCPFLFYQLYTLHAEVHGQIVPLLYSLLP